jgi:hypothetical protein
MQFAYESERLAIVARTWVLLVFDLGQTQRALVPILDKTAVQ